MNLVAGNDYPACVLVLSSGLKREATARNDSKGLVAMRHHGTAGLVASTKRLRTEGAPEAQSLLVAHNDLQRQQGLSFRLNTHAFGVRVGRTSGVPSSVLFPQGFPPSLTDKGIV